MKFTIWPPARGFSLFFHFLRRLAARCKLTNLVRIVRQIIHFGPWRRFPIALIKRMRGPARLLNATYSLLPGLGSESGPAALSAKLHHDGVAIAGVLPKRFVSELRALTDKLPPEEYHQSHEASAHIHAIAHDPGITNVLRAYLGCEPVLIEASLFVTQPETHLPVAPQNHFHFDYAGWQSLNVFVYLTDVFAGASHHVAIKGSHRHIQLKDIVRGIITEDEAASRFAGASFPITGPAGTVFFENVEVFHKRTRGNERRVMLNLTYTSHRNLFSYGRASQRHLAYRDKMFSHYPTTTKQVYPHS